MGGERNYNLGPSSGKPWGLPLSSTTFYPDSQGWSNVSHCNLLKTTVCNIGNLPVDSDYRVRVGALSTQNNIFWSYRRHINIQRSQLIAPTFTLSSTSYSVRVKIYRKQILNEIFTNGVQYTTYLWPAGQENQTLTKIDGDEDDDDGDGDMTFTSLQPLQVYCVLVKVESTANDASNISPVHCIKLPTDWTLVICLILLGLMGIMAFLMLCVCFLRRPQKMPSALKLVSVWKPMTIESVQVETVTEKGWIIISKNTDTKCIEFIEEDKERRESLDSGVSIEQLQLSVSNTKTEGQNGDVQVDSGCGSLEGTEGSGSVRRTTGQFSIHDCSGENEGTGDSGLGLGHHEGSGSLEGEDTELLPRVVAGDGYRSQSPSSVDVLNDMESNMAAPSAGYRSGQVTCMCSSHEYCIWCKFKNPFSETCQTVTQLQTDFRLMDDGNDVSCNYSKKGLMQTVLNMEDPVIEPVLSDTNCAESSVILWSCPLLQNEQKQDCTIDTRSFTLDNMELTFS
ncbi:interleukin-10 receptor subunit alpha isoform X2 [Tachysurus vachellii]|uniref:interleukin-10 receptor subunit alpha isoform X2 n=1 Tax=Tachysurus vachellii TaxID=175792 RepID=UPI00296AE05B|nr:interleukin-10 receptor subunit alpha isoform X2 [Tachysurus vachellii]